ncbi:hypothetical protein [Microcoleus sp. N9_B1]|uniref:hypothetical protein n=1 Tax=Microcoleus sp. N9_B1 TaxID=3055384 RepID=UPI002FCF3BA9
MNSHCQPRLEDGPFGGGRQGFLSCPSPFPRESKQSIRVRFCFNASAPKKIGGNFPDTQQLVLDPQFVFCSRTATDYHKLLRLGIAAIAIFTKSSSNLLKTLYHKIL